MASALQQVTIGNMSAAADLVGRSIEGDCDILSRVNREEMHMLEQVNDKLPAEFGPAFACALWPAYVGDLPEASRRLRLLAETRPDKGIIWLHLGRIARAQSQEQDMLAYYTNALDCALKTDEAMWMVGGAYARADDVDGLNILASRLPRRPEPLEFLVGRALEHGDKPHDLIVKLLRHGGGRFYTAGELLETAELKQVKTHDLVGAASRIPILDFESRDRVLSTLLERGEVRRARKGYAELLDLGHRWPPAVLRFLVATALEGRKSTA